MTDINDKKSQDEAQEFSQSEESELSREEMEALERWHAMADSSAPISDSEVEAPFALESEAKAKTKAKKSKKKIQGASAQDVSPEIDGLLVDEDPLVSVEASSKVEVLAVSHDQLTIEDFETELESNAELEANEFALEARPSLEPVALTLESMPSEDKQGLMRWDEAINLEAQIEAIIFATPKPISIKEIAEVLADDDGIEPNHDLIENHVHQLQRLYKERNGGFRLEYDKGAGFQFRTIPAAAPLMERMFSSKQRPLSRAAHETLAIIAYRQPCTRADIEFIRGVDAGSIIKNLLERDLVACVGRKEDSGRPMLFGTTSEFLRVFRLPSLNELPPLAAFQPRSEEMIQAFQKIENQEDAIDVEGFIGDEDRDPIAITQHQLAEFAASETQIDVREDALLAPAPAQIRRVGGSYDDEGFSRDDGFEDTKVDIESRDSISPRGGENADRGTDIDQRQSGERARDED